MLDSGNLMGDGLAWTLLPRALRQLFYPGFSWTPLPGLDRDSEIGRVSRGR